MKRVLLIIGVITIIVCAGWAYSSWTTLRANARTSEFNKDVSDLFDALQKYKERVGSYPVGNNAEVVQTLMGNNSKNLIIIVGSKKNMNSKGELVDPWGTPFRMYFSGEGILIRSAGPNKRFDDTAVQNFDDFIRSN